MEQFEITVEETLSHSAIIEAENYDEAVKKAQALYNSGEILLDSSDYLEVKIY